MHVTQVAPYPVYPPTSGGSKRIHGLFSTTDDADVVRYVQSSVTTDGLAGDELAPSPDVTELRDTSALQSLVGAVGGWLGLPPFHLSAVLRRRRPPELTRALAHADVIVVEHPWQFPYVDEATPDETPLVYSSHNVEPELVAKETRLGQIAHRRVARLEETVLAAADATVAVSGRDRRVYQEQYSSVPEIHLAPNGVPARAVSSETVAPTELSRGLFVGSDHPPNVEAVKEICRIAHADATPDEFVFDIVGTVCRRIDESDVPDAVQLHGFVDSLDPFYERCGVGLNPITSGSGSNVKLPEYLARGLAVVSTPFGTRGYDLIDGEHLFIARSGEFGATLRQLTERPEETTAVADRGRQRVADRYTWESVSRRYLSFLNDLTT